MDKRQGESKIVAPNKHVSIAVFVIADIVIAAISTIMPFVFRFGIFSINTGVSAAFLSIALRWFPLDALILVGVNAVLKLYNRVWAYASVAEMYDCIKSDASWGVQIDGQIPAGSRKAQKQARRRQKCNDYRRRRSGNHAAQGVSA